LVWEQREDVVAGPPVDYEEYLVDEGMGSRMRARLAIVEEPEGSEGSDGGEGNKGREDVTNRGRDSPDLCALHLLYETTVLFH
jgi:hypothetical protein